jgi:tRNA modification GTPase
MNGCPIIAACLSPPGRSALATVGVLGPGAARFVDSFFQPRNPRADPDRPRLGCFGGEAGDQVVVTVVERCGREQVEIHCHGGKAAIRWIIDRLVAGGATEVPWQDWLRHTEPSPLRALAAIALAQATTMRTAAILLDQWHGALEKELAGLVQVVQSGESAAARRRLQEFLDLTGVGLHLTVPWRVVLAGAANVGKSSLMNALLGHDRAITSPAPGTTRDVLTARTAMDGWPVELVDAAGEREEAQGLEALGLERARQTWTTAELCLWVVDASVAPVLPAAGLSCPVLLVKNKIDLPPAWETAALPHELKTIDVSARTGAGLEGLRQAIVQALVPGGSPPPGAAVPFDEDICRLLRELHAAIETGTAEHVLPEIRRLLGRADHRRDAEAAEK